MYLPNLFKRWLSPSRIVPLLTILGAGIAIVLSLLKIIDLGLAEEIILALLALLATDALTERINILERIERTLNGQSRSLKLEGRKDFSLPFDKRLENANQVYLLGMNLIGIVSQYQGLFYKRIQEGCRFKFVTVDPGFYSLGAPASWHGSQKQRDRALEHSTFIIKKLIKRFGQDKVELGYIPFPPPFTLLIVDPDIESGEVQVEFYTYERNPFERPHFSLTQDIDHHWYSFFRREFDLAWEQSRKYDPHEETLDDAELQDIDAIGIDKKG